MSKFINEQKINKITLFKKIHNFCPMGDDWYTNQLTIEIEPGTCIPDYIEIEQQLNELESKSLIVEDVVNKISLILQQYEIKSAHIISEVDDAVHLKVRVEKVINN